MLDGLESVDLKGIDTSKLSRAELEELVELLGEAERREKQRAFFRLYPETGPLRRELYPRHMEFFRVGARYRERCFRAANRVGKTLGGGGYEMVCHLTGLYPDWWVGRRFPTAVRAWAAGKKNETTRDIVQGCLVGAVRDAGARKVVDGTGLIPGNLLGPMTWKQGVQDLIDTIAVKHVSGEWSLLGFKSYQQGRGAFEGTAQHVIWLDEEPPMDIYGEALTRTATTGGILMLTFTPLDGRSDVVKQFETAEELAA